MNRFVYTSLVTLLTTGFAVAQSTPDSTGRTAPADTTSPQNRQSDGVRRDTTSRPAPSGLERRVERATDQLKQDIDRAEDRLRNRVQDRIDDLRANELPLFERGNWMAQASVGVGIGRGTSKYVGLSPRVGYFVRRGVAVGLRLSFDRRFNTSYHANQGGPFVRWYFLRNRFSAFTGGAYNFGREFANDINERARFNSISLEVGAMVQILNNLGAELSLENNYYDRFSGALDGRATGGRFRFGVAYFFDRSNRRR